MTFLTIFLITFPACLGFIVLAAKVVSTWRRQDQVDAIRRVLVTPDTRPELYSGLYPGAKQEWPKDYRKPWVSNEWGRI